MTLLLLIIKLVVIWKCAIDGYIRARPEQSCCSQLLTHGSDPNLRRRETEVLEMIEEEHCHSGL